jgi:glucan 1,3-beta-glucosidase
MPPSPLEAGERLHCVSYAPFRDNQTPLDPTTVIPPEQIDRDLAELAKLTNCIRIYSVDMGLERIPELAGRHGLKVLLGVWISSEARRNDQQIRVGVALANRFPDTVAAVIVGNEVLLRGEMTAATLEGYLASVKAQVKVPVTYADVWEFWLRNSHLAGSVDFVTVHILPYWEDHPIAADRAADHITSIRSHVATRFPGKEILIGEAGWPSQGRMREGARPSPANQARVLHDLYAMAREQKFRVNLIEAFDQPWKRYLEGTVGGYWGLFSEARTLKFVWGAPVSNHPYWPWQALGGVLLAAAVLGLGLRRSPEAPAAAGNVPLAPLAIIAVSGGLLAGAAVEAAAIEALGIGGWLRSVMLAVVAIATPLAAAAAFGRGTSLPAIVQVIGPPARRSSDATTLVLGALLIATCLLAVEAALGLAFNPRYLDFAYAALTSAVIPLLLLTLFRPGARGPVAAAEGAIAVLIGLCAVKIAWAETLANWEALWLCGALLALSVTLARVRAAPG